MKLTIHLEGKNKAELAKGLQAHLALFAAEEKSAIDVSELKKGKGKKAAAEEEDDSEDEIEEEDESEDEESEEEESEEEEEDESEEEEESEDEEESEEDEDDSKSLKLGDADLSKLKLALNKFSKKNGKEKAIKLLNKFAKTSQDVKKSDLPKLLKALKV